MPHDSAANRTLDWHSYHDPRSRQYRSADILNKVTARQLKRSRVFWKRGVQLDQGQDGACVGFSWTQELFASPVRVAITPPVDPNGFATGIYHRARQLDDTPGENYEGTSVLAGAKTIQEAGWMTSYRWAFGIADVIQALLYNGPVVLGIPWYDDMFTPDLYGEIHKGGGLAGGHAILATGYHGAKQMHPASSRPARPMIHLQNSWGEWGQDGGAWIEDKALSELLHEDGEACVPIGRHRGEIQ
jgi:hypothetical protein